MTILKAVKIALGLFFGYWFLLPILGGILFIGMLYLSNLPAYWDLFTNKPKVESIHVLPNKGLQIGSAKLLEDNTLFAYLLLNDGTAMTIDKSTGKIATADMFHDFYLIQNVQKSVPECNIVEKYCIVLTAEYDLKTGDDYYKFFHHSVIKYFYISGKTETIYQSPLGIRINQIIWYPNFLELTLYETSEPKATTVFVNTKKGVYLKNPTSDNDLVNQLGLHIGTDNLNGVNLRDAEEYSWKNGRDTYLDHQSVKTKQETVGYCGELSTCHSKITLLQDNRIVYAFSVASGSTPIGQFGSRYYYVGQGIGGSQYIGIIDLSSKGIK